MLGVETEMKYIVSADEMKLYDRNTIEKIGIPAIVLMERAALSAFKRIRERLSDCGCKSGEGSVLVMAGMGNNGADGLALARLLAEEGIPTEVWCVGEEKRVTDLWKRQREILTHYSVEFSAKPGKKEYNILVDALFGVGLSRELEGSYKNAVECFSKLGGYRLALDMPSGIHGDTGKILGTAVYADETVTFGFCKRGLVLYPGCEAAGEVITAQIGITEAAFFGRNPEWFTYDEKPADLLPKRDRAGNKGTFGKVLLIAGSENMSGAATLAAKAAYRTGAGMVKVVTLPENREILQQTVPEALLQSGTDLTAQLQGWADVVVIGPGIGKDSRAYQLLEQVLKNCRLPMVIDADGLNLLAEHVELRDLCRETGKAGRNIILTPHMGELSRLTGKSVTVLKESPADCGKELAEELGAVVVAKDARTLVCACGEKVYVNLTGNSGMATAGSGDVLAGMLGALLAQGMKSYEAACAGVYLHGAAGDRAARELGEYGCMAGDLVALCDVMKERDLGKDK